MATEEGRGPMSADRFRDEFSQSRPANRGTDISDLEEGTRSTSRGQILHTLTKESVAEVSVDVNEARAAAAEMYQIVQNLRQTMADVWRIDAARSVVMQFIADCDANWRVSQDIYIRIDTGFNEVN